MSTVMEETDPYLAEAPPEGIDIGRADPFERALARLGWVRVEHGVYLHDDGSEIHCHQGFRKGTNVAVRYFTLEYPSGQSGGVSMDLPALVETHRVKGGNKDSQ